MNPFFTQICEALSIGALYVILAPRISQSFYRYQLFHPDSYLDNNTAAPMLENIPGEDVFFNGKKGAQLHAWYFKSPKSRWTIHFSHGNGGNLETRKAIITLLLQAGVSVFLYDYQGYGISEGRPSISGICADALAAYDYLTINKKIDPDKIVLYGESLGASVAAYLSSMRPCGALILQSGFSSLRKIAVQTLPYLIIYPEWLFPQPSLDTLAVVKQPHSPLLIIHGEQDQIVTIDHADQLFSEAIEPKEYLKLSKSAHNDVPTTEPQTYITAIKQFLNKIL